MPQVCLQIGMEKVFLPQVRFRRPARLEIAAFLIFISYGLKPSQSIRNAGWQMDAWILVIMAGCVGWLLALIMNFAGATFVAFRAVAPVLPHGFDQRFLVLETWGFLVPFIWGFSAKWLPIFLGLRALRPRHLLWAIGLNSAGVIAALFGFNLLKLSSIGHDRHRGLLFEIVRAGRTSSKN
jgi:hypothetical protein